MNLNNFTIKSQEVVQQAQNMAMQNNQQAIEPGHIMTAMIDADENIVPHILKKLNVNFNQFDQKLQAVVSQYPKVSGGNPYLSGDSSQAIQKATSPDLSTLVRQI
jgi:ATP-dependent Clp protease ATP-binding subunit ClpB